MIHARLCTCTGHQGDCRPAELPRSKHRYLSTVWWHFYTRQIHSGPTGQHHSPTDDNALRPYYATQGQPTLESACYHSALPDGQKQSTAANNNTQNSRCWCCKCTAKPLAVWQCHISTLLHNPPSFPLARVIGMENSTWQCSTLPEIPQVVSWARDSIFI